MKFKKAVATTLLCATLIGAGSITVHGEEIYGRMGGRWQSEAGQQWQNGRGCFGDNQQRGHGRMWNNQYLKGYEYCENNGFMFENNAKIYADIAGITEEEATNLAEEFGVSFAQLARDNGIFDKYHNQVVKNKIERFKEMKLSWKEQMTQLEDTDENSDIIEFYQHRLDMLEYNIDYLQSLLITE